MIVIDGSFGEGGGQIVRSSLTLSAVLGEPVRIDNIRAGRPKPGLANQHLAAARAVAKVCGGELSGAKKGSGQLVFEPGQIRAGHYSREIGSAGSTTLILQTLLPVLAAADRESAVTIHGGTHNPMAPPMDYLAECWLPALARIGFGGECELVGYGFYPKGGGAIRGRILPYEPRGPVEMADEVDWGEPEVTVLIANLPDHVAFREQNEAAKKLRIDPLAVKIVALPGEVGPGNAVMIRYRSEGRTALFTAFGEPGKKAERVALEAARAARNFARSHTEIDPRLADQLLVPLALAAGGSLTTSSVTEHLRTNAEVIEAFLKVKIEIEMKKPDRFLVTVPGTDRLGAARG